MTETQTFFWYMASESPPDENCWDWKGGTLVRGYGSFRMGQVAHLAHRTSYKIFNGDVGDLHVLHSCDRRICVQPAHLHLGTTTDNMRERDERGRTSMGERHTSSKLTGENVLWIRQSNLSHREIAKIFGVTHKTVGDILRGRTWKQL